MSSAQRANGMATIGGGVVLPGEAQRYGHAARGGAERSERRGALGGSDDKFNGAQVIRVVRRRTGVSGVFLGCWRSRMQAARVVRGLWARVADGALACSWHARKKTGRELGLWSSGWLHSELGQGVAMDGAACPRQGWRG